MPIPGDQRAWDAFIQRPGWRYGIEAETAPTDSQALIRRFGLKARDGQVDGVILVVRSTRRTRGFLSDARVSLHGAFELDGDVAMERLARGDDPRGNAIVVMPVRRRPACRGSK